MIEVEMPDGTVLEFPEGTSPDVMRGAAQKFWQQSSSQNAPQQAAQQAGQGRAVIPGDGTATADAMQGRGMGWQQYADATGIGGQRRAQPEPMKTELAGGVAGAFGAGVVRGAANLMDLPGAAFNAGGGLLVSGMERLGLPEDIAQATRQSLAAGPMGTGSTAREGFEATTGGASEYRSPSTAGQYAGTVGEFLPGAAAFGGMSPGNLLRYGVCRALPARPLGRRPRERRLSLGRARRRLLPRRLRLTRQSGA